MVSLTVDRVFSIEDGVPKAVLSVSEAEGIGAAIFKYKVSDRGSDFDSYISICTPEDLTKYGLIRTGGVTFYRKEQATITFTTLTSAVRAKIDISEEIQSLVQKYETVIVSFVGQDTVEYTSNE
tara:strand:- start:153 stop:524 length:372 start_codon:yes stop_codon:yes gene_type:complete